MRHYSGHYSGWAYLTHTHTHTHARTHTVLPPPLPQILFSDHTMAAPLISDKGMAMPQGCHRAVQEAAVCRSVVHPNVVRGCPTCTCYFSY